MSRKAYKSDLTDKEWRIIEPLIPPPKPGGHPRTVDMRSCRQCHLLSAANWVFMENVAPRLPTLQEQFITTFDAGKDEDFGSKSIKYYATLVRIKQGKAPQATAAIIDSQKGYTTEKKGKCVASMAVSASLRTCLGTSS